MEVSAQIVGLDSVPVSIKKSVTSEIDFAEGAMDSILSKLDELFKVEYKLQKSVKTDVECLSRELRSIDAVLRKVVEVPARVQLDSQVLFRAKQASRLSRRIEDIVDIFLLRVKGFEPAVIKSDGFRRLVKKMNPQHQLSDSIKEIQVQLKDVANWHASYWINGVVAIPTRPTTVFSRPLADGEQLMVVGVTEAKEELIGKMMLSDGSDDVSRMKQLKILSIVGFEGLGKTTLALLVYDMLQPQFDCGAFVSLSKSLDMKDAFEGIFVQLGVDSSINNEEKDLTQLITDIREFLYNKRYIIVVENLSNAGQWRNILCSLPSNLYGSRIITTTRVNHIAKLCCSGHDEWIYEIKHLGDLDSKRLFLNRVFGSEISWPLDAPTEVVDRMLKMCGGIPSAIITFASLLASKVTMEETWQKMMYSLHSAWKETMKSVVLFAHADIPGSGDMIMVLSLSYLHLPNNLKTLLRYLVTVTSSMKKQMIERDSLVRKWIAEGCIPEVGESSREEVAIGYLEELMNRDMIQSVENYGSCHGEETCQVNCLMLEVIRLMSQEEEEHFLDISWPSVPSRVFIECCDQDILSYGDLWDSSHVRSVTMIGSGKLVPINHLKHLRVLDLDGCEDVDNSVWDDICQKLLLRYLSLKQTQVTVIPPEISNLRYLETLDIRRTQISNLSGEIGKLQNLETLDVRQTRVKELPRELAQLPKLAHLYFGQSSSIGGVKLPAGSDHQFKSVKVIGTIDSRECSGSAMEEILSGFTGVRELRVLLYDGPADKEQNDKLLSCVAKCGLLRTLIIYGDSDPSVELPPASPNLFPLLEKLIVAGRFVRVPQWIAQLGALKKLDIRVCKLEPDHLGILGALPGLTTLALALICIPRKKQVAITGRPECFMKLEVFSFDCRVPWITFEQSAMPRLKHLHLKLYACAAAGKFPSGITHLESLEKIILRYSSEYEKSSGITEAVDVMRDEAARHGNLIELSVNGDYEVFLSNTPLDKKITGSEIEECY